MPHKEKQVIPATSTRQRLAEEVSRLEQEGKSPTLKVLERGYPDNSDESIQSNERGYRELSVSQLTALFRRINQRISEE